MRNGLIRFKTAALCVAACFGAVSNAAQAAPTLPQVAAGQATFAQDGNVFSITNTPGTIINWQSFSVNAGEVTRFIQQGSDSAVLNRIVGQDPSRILGALQSNGKVFLINPNGVVFGQNARVDVGGLAASTLNMSDADFLAGKKNFSAGPHAGSVRNEGAITTPGGGKVFLVAPNVENTGIIAAPNGEVVLAAGRSVQLADSGNPDLTVVVSAPADQAINLGRVVASGGRIGIYGALVNQRGAVNADSAVVGQDGKIVLKASRQTLLEQGSVTSATGAGRGGEVQLLGERVALTGNAQVDASGAAKGGTVLVGGDYQGKNAALQNARQTSFGRDAGIRADATLEGSGGKVVLWSDGATMASGSISARGAGGGDGGLIETSGRQLALDGIRVDAGARGGRTGTWLIDPANIEVSAGGSATDTTYITASTLTGTDADIVLQATNNINIAQNITTARSVRAEAGNELTIGAAVTSTAGSIDLRANKRITLAAGGALSSPNHIDLSANKMTLTGNIGGVAGVLPVLSFTSFDATAGILLRGSETSWALSLDPARLGSFGAYEINIGNSAHNGPISIDQELSMAGNLVIETRHSININAPVTLIGADSQFIGKLHESFGSGVSVTNVGVIDAKKRISLLGADQVQITGKLKSADIEISAAGGGIQMRRNPSDPDPASLTTRIEANNSLSLRTEGGLYQEEGTLIQASRLLLEGDSVEMLAVNQVGTLAGRASGAHAEAGLRFHWSGDLKIGTVDGVSGLRSAGDLTLVGDGLRADANIEAGRRMAIDAASITGPAIYKAASMDLRSRGGIGALEGALRTSTGRLNAVNSATGNSPINVLNDRVLVVDDVVQAGGGNTGAISIETSGGLTVAPTSGDNQGVRTGSGNIRMVTHSPLTIEGKVRTESGNVTLVAADQGALTIRAGGQVASGSGSVSLTGGAVQYPAGSVLVSDAGKLAVTRTGAPEEPRPDPRPPLDTCLTNPNTPGCNGVLEQATRDCIATPETGQCRQVLPQPQACRVDPSRLGCGAVLVRECIATPKAPSCEGVLPAYQACEANPQTYGCGPVVAEYREIERCVATPKAPSCVAVLPLYETCAAKPNAHGCAPVIAEREAIAACIKEPGAAGCAQTLPPLETCRKDGNVYGCVPVIERAEFLACVANPAASGCAARLPALSVCKLTPGREGCAQVLQLSFNACLANPHDASCVGILPTLSQCVIDKSMNGCQVVLPTLQQCIGSPTLQGCSVQLPKLEQCAANPAIEGCVAVLPKPDFCSTHPRDPTCQIFNPNPGSGNGDAKKPVSEAQQAVVRLADAQAKSPARPGNPDGGGDGKPGDTSENQAGPAAGTNSGVKNEKPATKMYCN